MKITDELRAQVRDKLANTPPYPDVQALIASGDLRKVRGGYSVLTTAGFEAIKYYVASTMSPHDTTKPAVFTLHRRRKS
ncbi:hypothetical protein CHR26_11550 [Pseudomonas putida]|nr:hypothetical protein CHR26_11550 [Pseudomonas putida]